MQPQGRTEDAPAWGILPTVCREGAMVSGAVFYALADTLPLWAPGVAFILAGVVILIVLFVWDANNDE